MHKSKTVCTSGAHLKKKKKSKHREKRKSECSSPNSLSSENADYCVILIEGTDAIEID